jgi:hypothetical protein
MDFVSFSLQEITISFICIYQLIFVIETRCVFFDVRTEFLNIIYVVPLTTY